VATKQWKGDRTCHWDEKGGSTYCGTGLSRRSAITDDGWRQWFFHPNKQRTSKPKIAFSPSNRDRPCLVEAFCWLFCVACRVCESVEWRCDLHPKKASISPTNKRPLTEKRLRERQRVTDFRCLLLTRSDILWACALHTIRIVALLPIFCA
jgi:hypothetical protein